MGGSPAGIIDDIPIDLGRPRDFEALETTHFLQIKRHIRETLMPERTRRALVATARGGQGGSR